MISPARSVKWRAWTSTAACIVVLAAGLASCKARPSRERAASIPGERACMVLPPFSNSVSAAAQAALQAVAPGAAVYRAQDLGAALERCSAQRRMLVLADARNLPVDAWTSVVAHIEQGWPVVFWGRDPLEGRVVSSPGGFVTRQQQDDKLLSESESAHSLPPLQEWKAGGGSGAGVTSAPVAVAELPWGGAQVTVDGFRDWAGLVLEPVAPDAVAYDRNAVALYARGGGNTSRLVIECDEQDGSRWFAVLDVASGWKPFLVREEAFRHAHGGKDRGQAGDHLRLKQITRMAIGLSMGYANQPPGSHVYALSEVRFVADNRPAAQVLDWPDLPMLSPPYRRYQTSVDLLEVVGETSRPFAVRGLAVQCPIRRALGAGGAAGAPYRWIPLARGLGRLRAEYGAPVSLWVEPREDGRLRQFAWIGIDAAPDHAALDAACLRAVMGRLLEGAFLYQSGTPKYSFKAGEPLQATARWAHGWNTNRQLRAMFELVDPRGDVLRHAVSPPPDANAAAGGPLSMTLGPAPQLEAETRSCTLRVSLLDRRGATVYDVLEQPVRFVSPPDLAREDRILAGSPQLTIAGRPLALLGVNYWPLSAMGMRTGEYNPHWLQPGVFDPEQISRDLDRLREVGVNALSVQYLDVAEATQLRYLAEEARLRRMWIDVFIPYLQPMDQDFEKAAALIRAAELSSLPRVFAIDIAWEPRFGLQDQRRRFDPEWRLWLEEQYGNVAHAEFVLRYPLWRHKGQVTCPPDADLLNDGPHRGAVAAYRRFMDDVTSRRYGEVVRFLRGLGVDKLVSARTGFGGTGSAWAAAHAPVDPAAGAVHLDFISPEGWSLVTPEDYSGAGFITAYCRGMSGGKPVVWKEFGASVGPRPASVDLRNQARVYEQMFDMALRSRSSGCFAWWYPGGWRVDEGSDMGVVNPDGTWREVRGAFSDFTFKLRQLMRTPPAWRGREMDRDADARGLHGLWEKWKPQYRDELAQDRMEEIRPAGFSRETENMEIVSLGGGVFNEPAPMAQVNAEWGAIEVDGQPVVRRPGEAVRIREQQRVRMELINTGPATWSASAPRRERTVWVRAKPASVSPTQLPLNAAVPYGGRVWVEFVFPDHGPWTLRPWLYGTGEFGESLRIDVAQN